MNWTAPYSRHFSAKFFGGPKLALLSCAASTEAMSAHVLKEMALTLERSRGAVILSRNDVDRALAESNARSTADISDYAYVLETGVITMQNSGAVLLKDENIRKAYLEE